MLATTALVLGLLYVGRAVLAPFALAVILSVVLESAVRRVERLGLGRWRFGRGGAVIAVTVTIGLLLGGLGWVVAREVSGIGDELPTYQRRLAAKLREPIAGLQRTARGVEEIAEIAEPAERGAPAPKVEVVDHRSAVLDSVTTWAGSVASLAGTAAVVFVLVVFLLFEAEELRDRVLRLLGRSELRTTGSALRDAARRVATYLRALALLNFGHGLVVGVGLAVLGLPAAQLFGLLSAVLRFVPYVGPLVTAAAPLVMAAAVGDDFSLVLQVALFLAAVELVSNNLVEPFLFGASLGLSPFAVVASAVFWAWMWGPLGLVLATPLTVSLAVIGRHVPALSGLAVLLSSRQALRPHEKLYERLAVSDVDAAREMVEAQAAARSASELWDEVLLPALRLLDRDRLALELDDEELGAAREVFAWALDAQGEPPATKAPAAVLCAPTAVFADEIACVALARELEARGVVARATSRLLTSELLDRIAAEDCSVLCLSAFSTRGSAIRSLVKRLQAARPGLQIVIAHWCEDAARLPRLRESLPAAAPLEIVATFADAADRLASWAQRRPASARAAL